MNKKIFNAKNLEVVTYHQEPIKSLTPNPGWVEQDPNEILDKTIFCMEKAVEKFEQLGYRKTDIKSSKITVKRRRFKKKNYFSFCSNWSHKST